MDPDEIRGKLAALRHADSGLRVFGASVHKWDVEPLPEGRVCAFEKQHGVELPADFRRHLLEVGVGAGPAIGVFPPGEWRATGGLAPWTDEDVAPLIEPFPHRAEWTASRADFASVPARRDRAKGRYPGFVPGTLPISSLFWSESLVLLVITGEERGRVWVDERDVDEQWRRVYPVGLGFDDTYATWLENAAAAALPTSTPRRPSTSRSPDVPAEVVDRLRTAVRDARGPAVPLGAIGRFRRGRRRLTFIVGEGLRRAANGDPLPDDDAGTVFGAALATARAGFVAEVDGLFSLWTWRSARRDWLGRAEPDWIEVVVEVDGPG